MRGSLSPQHCLLQTPAPYRRIGVSPYAHGLSRFKAPDSLRLARRHPPRRLKRQFSICHRHLASDDDTGSHSQHQAPAPDRTRPRPCSSSSIRRTQFPGTPLIQQFSPLVVSNSYTESGPVSVHRTPHIDHGPDESHDGQVVSQAIKRQGFTRAQ